MPAKREAAFNQAPAVQAIEKGTAMTMARRVSRWMAAGALALAVIGPASAQGGIRFNGRFQGWSQSLPARVSPGSAPGTPAPTGPGAGSPAYHPSGNPRYPAVVPYYNGYVYGCAPYAGYGYGPYGGYVLHPAPVLPAYPSGNPVYVPWYPQYVPQRPVIVPRDVIYVQPGAIGF